MLRAQKFVSDFFVISGDSEKGLRGALRVSGGDLGCLFASPVSWVLIVLSVIGIFSPILMAKFEKKVTGGEVLEE